MLHHSGRGSAEQPAQIYLPSNRLYSQLSGFAAGYGPYELHSSSIKGLNPSWDIHLSFLRCRNALLGYRLSRRVVVRQLQREVPAWEHTTGTKNGTLWWLNFALRQLSLLLLKTLIEILGSAEG